MPSLARREQKIASFQVMHLVGEAHRLMAEGHDVIHLEVGEPDFPTPEPVIAAAQAALTEGATFYSPTTGIAGLQQALADSYQQRYGLSLAPERFILTPGASGALQVVLGLTLDPGDTLLVPEPGYPCNRHIGAFLGVAAQCAPLSAHDGFAIDRAWLSKHWPEGTRALLVSSPANPTGKVLCPDELSTLIAWCDEQDAHLIVDEIYHGLDHTGARSQTALERSDDLWVVNSFSKYYGMTGWRLGWVVVPDYAVDAANRVCQNLFLAPTTVSQHAALRALQPDMTAEYQRRAQAFRARRDCLLQGLEQLGLTVPVAGDGAFYLYVDVSSTGMDAERFCYDLLAEEHVAVTPGHDFGGPDPERYVRFAYTCDLPRLEQALARLGRFLSRHGGHR